MEVFKKRLLTVLEEEEVQRKLREVLGIEETAHAAPVIEKEAGSLESGTEENKLIQEYEEQRKIDGEGKAWKPSVVRFRRENMEQENEVKQSSEERATMESIHAIHTLRISQEKIDKIKGYIRKGILAEVPTGIKAKLKEMKDHVQQLPENTFIPVKEEPFVFGTNLLARLLVEDVNRLKLGLANACRRHDDCYEAGEENSLLDASSLKWRLCSENEAAHLCQWLQWPEKVKLELNPQQYTSFQECVLLRNRRILWKYDDLFNADLGGITLIGKETYYRFGSGISGDFNSGDRVLIADLYVSPVPEDELALPYILGKGYTPDEGEDQNFWPVLAMLLTHGLVKIVIGINEGTVCYGLSYKEADFTVEALENIAQDAEKGALVRSYFQLPDVETLVEETFEGSAE